MMLNASFWFQPASSKLYSHYNIQLNKYFFVDETLQFVRMQ